MEETVVSTILVDSQVCGEIIDIGRMKLSNVACLLLYKWNRIKQLPLSSIERGEIAKLEYNVCIKSKAAICVGYKLNVVTQ